MTATVRRLFITGVIALASLAAPSLASAAQVYASAPMGGPGGQWSDSSGYITYNRMSAPGHPGVSVRYCSDATGCVGWAQAQNFLQIGVGQYFATVYCRNLWGTITAQATGYCKWF